MAITTTFAFLSMAFCFVLMVCFILAENYEEEKLTHGVFKANWDSRHPYLSEHVTIVYGYSYYLGWLAVASR